MTVWIFIALCVAGGVGAALRLYLDSSLRTKVTNASLFATGIINISGSLVLGVLTGLALGHIADSALLAIVGTGLLGGYTTFSTASFESVRLFRDHRYVLAVANGLGVLAISIATATLGIMLGATI